MNQELPDVEDEFWVGRGSRDKMVNIRRTVEKAREFQKNIYFCFIDYSEAFDSGSQQTGKFLKRSPNLPLEKPVCNS